MPLVVLHEASGIEKGVPGGPKNYGKSEPLMVPVELLRKVTNCREVRKMKGLTQLVIGNPAWRDPILCEQVRTGGTMQRFAEMIIARELMMKVDFVDEVRR